MPCNSAYMDPTPSELAQQEAAELACYTLRCLERDVPEWLKSESKTLYAKDRGQVRMLCELIRGMSDKERSVIMYDGRSTSARRLASWWERHLEADKRREEEEERALREERADEWREAFCDAIIDALDSGLTTDDLHTAIVDVARKR